MSRFFEAFQEPSEKNGTIYVRRFLWRWEVMVDGYDQSSPYIRKMWRGALSRITHHASPNVKRVLVLGLGAGSIINDLHKRFPGCAVTVIEWDPMMVKIAERIRLFRPEFRPEILVGDALEIVPTLEKNFDLIIFDLYRGKRPELRLSEPSFQQALHDRLSSDGRLLVNVFSTPSLLAATDAFFTREQTWQYRFNRLALYRP